MPVRWRSGLGFASPVRPLVSGQWFFFYSLSSFSLSSCFFLLTSCGEKKTKETHEEEKSETEVALTEAQFKTIGIETGGIEMKNLNTVIKANGYTAVPPQNMANISTLIGGVVKDIYVLEGTFVSKGKLPLLFLFEGRYLLVRAPVIAGIPLTNDMSFIGSNKCGASFFGL